MVQHNKIAAPSSKCLKPVRTNLVRSLVDARVLEPPGFDISVLLGVVIRELIMIKTLELEVFRTLDPIIKNCALDVDATDSAPAKIIAQDQFPCL